MTVFVDNMRMKADVPNGARIVRGRWSHMVADTHEELVAMADKLGLKREWIQYPGTWKEHYDVTESKRAAAFKLGAVELIIGPDWKTFYDKKRRTDPVLVARLAVRTAAAAAVAALTADTPPVVDPIPYECQPCGYRGATIESVTPEEGHDGHPVYNPRPEYTGSAEPAPHLQHTT